MYIVTEKDLIGDIEGFPIEVVQKMVDRQFEQKGECDISKFQRSRFSGFDWSETPENGLFWHKVICRRNFDLFFDRYPKQEELPLPRMVLAWDIDESDARERELLHILPESFGLDFRYVVRSYFDPKDVIVVKHMKELPPRPKKMTKSEIEKELGYKIELINN